VKSFSASLQHRPDAPATRVQLGYALHACGKTKAAVEAWHEVLRMHPDDPEASEALGLRNRTVDNEPNLKPARLGSGIRPKKAPDGPESERRTVASRLATRGPVDRAIIRDVWEQDAYGVRVLAESPATVLDIGAHIGVFTCLAAELWPDARIIACEPDPDNAALLRSNSAGLRNVEVIETAIIDRDLAQVEFNAVTDKIGKNSGGGSCVRAEVGSNRIQVPALSAVKLWESKSISSCDLMKLDCEGAELQVLRALAAAGLLARVIRIVGEWHACDGRKDAPARVRSALHRILEKTHDLVFREPFRGREGHFSAGLRR
jgi:FkbM family methyltransferase